MLTVRSRTTADSGALTDTLTSEQPFTNNNSTLLGLRNNGSLSVGQLYGVAFSLYSEHRDTGLITYVIRSYSTPIAWKVHYSNGDSAWWLPCNKYSTTTSKHQSLITCALYDLPDRVETILDLDRD